MCVLICTPDSSTMPVGPTQLCPVADGEMYNLYAIILAAFANSEITLIYIQVRS